MTPDEIKQRLDAIGRPVAEWSSFRAVSESLTRAKEWDAANPTAAAEYRRLCVDLERAEREDAEHVAALRRAEKLAAVLERSGVGERSLSAALQAKRTEALEAAAQWLQGGKRQSWLVLAGTTGSGKTVAAAWALREAAAQGESVALCRASELARTSQFDAGAATLARLKRVGVLVLDDFGAEHLTAYGAGLLGEVLDARHEAQLRTIVTTNLSAADLKARVGDRVVDRWRQDGRVVVLAGKSMRGAP